MFLESEVNDSSKYMVDGISFKIRKDIEKVTIKAKNKSTKLRYCGVIERSKIFSVELIYSLCNNALSNIRDQADTKIATVPTDKIIVAESRDKIDLIISVPYAGDIVVNLKEQSAVLYSELEARILALETYIMKSPRTNYTGYNLDDVTGIKICYDRNHWPLRLSTPDITFRVKLCDANIKFLSELNPISLDINNYQRYIYIEKRNQNNTTDLILKDKYYDICNDTYRAILATITNIGKCTKNWNRLKTVNIYTSGNIDMSDLGDLKKFEGLVLTVRGSESKILNIKKSLSTTGATCTKVEVIKWKWNESGYEQSGIDRVLTYIVV